MAVTVGTNCGVSCRVASAASALVAGGLFGAGLAISGMTQPSKVVGFLNFAGGAWDPSLAFVIAGAIAVYALVFRVVLRQRKAPWFDKVFHIPSRKDLDLGLIGGAAIFGAGWGLGGYCPGPGLVSAAAGHSSAILFIVAMLGGMLLQHRMAKK
ncbi:MAG: YeeE/YedE family protein [Myxococcales bacterium]|nr:YeeE/YedE family protein [Myxococcales bacterium]